MNTKPSDDQKGVLRGQLDRMDPNQWLAMARWIVDKLVEDQQFLTELISDEVERRQRRHAAHHVGSEFLWHAALMSVLKDLGLSIGMKKE